MSRHIHLASRSPRRREILEWAGFKVSVCPADVDETWNGLTDLVQHALDLAQRKAEAISTTELLLAGDTIVHIDHCLFEKPADADEAFAHLSALSGRWHDVTTAVCLRYRDTLERFAQTTRVRFRDLSEAEIHQYILSGEPLDKAGAYGIQGLGGNLVAEVRGSWTNVKGLPLESCLQHIQRLTDTPS